MSSCAKVRAILLADAAFLTAMGNAPEARVVVGLLPFDTPLPAVGLMELTSSQALRPLAKSAKRKVRARVEITVLAATYAQKEALIDAARNAMDLFIGSADDADGVTTQLDSRGQDFNGPNGTAFVGQSQDVMVTYDENA